MLFKFKQGYEAANNIWYMKGEVAVDYNAVTRWLKKLHSGYKNLNNQTRSGRSKIMAFKAMLQVVKANLVSGTYRVSGEFGISV